MRGYKNFEGSPRPGDLRHRVQIGYTENAVNENGYPEPRDVGAHEEVRRRWHDAQDAIGGEETAHDDRLSAASAGASNPRPPTPPSKGHSGVVERAC